MKIFLCRRNQKVYNGLDGKTAIILLNPFKPNGISHYYQLDQSISILRLVGWYFRILYKF